MNNIPPGWYPDPEGAEGERWWDGTKWTSRTSGSPTDVPPPPPPGGWVQPLRSYPRSSNAGWALGLSIVGILCCAPLSIAGLIMGRSEMNSIDNGLTSPSNRGMAKAAFIIGVVAVSIWAFAVVWVGFVGSFAGSAGS